MSNVFIYIALSSSQYVKATITTVCNKSAMGQEMLVFWVSPLHFYLLFLAC
jgi:hypothetical protein